MSFIKVSEQDNSVQTRGTGKPNPWFRFPRDPKTNFVDRNGPEIKFRFLQELDETFISRTHWDDDLKKPVSCARAFERSPKDGKLWPKGDCIYCNLRKAFKKQWDDDKANGVQPAASQQYAPKKWAMKAVTVSPVAVLVDKLDEEGKQVLDSAGDPEQEQKFYLLPLSVMDYFYPQAKGFHKFLKGATTSKKTLLKHWFTLSPADFLALDLPLDKVEAKAQVVGLEDLDEQIENAAPFPYDEAVKLREQLATTGSGAQSYEAAIDEAQAEVKATPNSPKTGKTKPGAKSDKPLSYDTGSNEIYEDDLPPF